MENPTDHDGKSIMYTRIKFLEKKTKQKFDIKCSMCHFFLNDYIQGSVSFLILIKHEVGYLINVYDDIVNESDEKFEFYFIYHDLHAFKNKMFHIWDGNHGFKVWYNIKK